MLRKSLIGAVAVLGIALAGSVASAQPASAGYACGPWNGYCGYFLYPGWGWGWNYGGTATITRQQLEEVTATRIGTTHWHNGNWTRATTRARPTRTATGTSTTRLRRGSLSSPKRRHAVSTPRAFPPCASLGTACPAFSGTCGCRRSGRRSRRLPPFAARPDGCGRAGPGVPRNCGSRSRRSARSGAS